MAKYGEVEEVDVCDNIGDHMVGNVYIKFKTEEEAQKAYDKLNGIFYDARVIYAEYCPLTDFDQGRCKQYLDGKCERGGYCNYIHKKHIPKKFRKALKQYMYLKHPDYKEAKK